MNQRTAPIEMQAENFRAIGHRLVDRIADFLDSLPERPVTRGESPPAIRETLNSSRLLPDLGTDPEKLIDRAADLLFDHSLFNSHPRFWGYITASAAPIGILGDFLASAVNQNTGAWFLSPMASEIEAQTVRWIAELLGFSTSCGGMLVSGGNMANIVCFLAARQAKAGWDV
ncbi:MAG: pyridoxal-dependent decarboxylase, partial [Anaerolineales bacterium]|nr:pyridoxal-dependent decarboxylase [Anaerolineales bacterium]